MTMTMSRLASSLTRCVVLGVSALLVLGAAAGCSLIDGLQGGDEEPFPEPFPDPFPDPLPPDGMACAQAGPLFTALTIESPAGPMNSDFDGEAQIIDVDPDTSLGTLTLDLNNNQTVRFIYDLGNGVLPLKVGDAVHASVRVRPGPLLPDAALALSDVLPDGTPALLIAAMWDSSDENILEGAPGAAALGRYLRPDCVPASDGCGDLVPLELEVSVPGIPTVVIQPGTELISNGFRAINSINSFEYVGPVQCADIPSRRFVGSVIRMQ